MTLASLDTLPDSLYAWYNLPIKEDVETALKELEDFISLEGPFDGILGFSQGGLLVATLLLRDAARSGGRQLPFTMAVFISSFAPHNIDGKTIVWDRKDEDLVVAASTEASESRVTDWKSDQRTAFDYNILKNSIDKISFPITLLRKYNARHDDVRIEIPTLFVRGRQEPNNVGFDELIELISAQFLKVSQHDGGHEFPRQPEEITRMAELMIQMSLL